MPQFARLRALGRAGEILATALAILMNNWPLTLSVIAGIAAGSLHWLRATALNPAVYVSVAAFLAVLWTIVGLLALRDRRKPRLIQTHADYRYGLTFEGFIPNFTPTNSEMPEPGGLQFAIQIRNFSPGPIKYSLEDVDIRIGSRTIPKYVTHTISGYMARGAGRHARPDGFKGGTLSEFFGKGVTEGTANFSICYGAPDGPFLRRLKLSLKLMLIFPREGVASAQAPFGYSDSILSEIDESA